MFHVQAQAPDGEAVSDPQARNAGWSRTGFLIGGRASQPAAELIVALAYGRGNAGAEAVYEAALARVQKYAKAEILSGLGTRAYLATTGRAGGADGVRTGYEIGVLAGDRVLTTLSFTDRGFPLTPDQVRAIEVMVLDRLAAMPVLPPPQP